jgi:predicted dehydrogenase
MTESNKSQSAVSRRSFLKSSAAAGFGAALGGSVIARAGGAAGQDVPEAKPVPRPVDLKIALIGAGEQGRVLMESCLRIPGIRIAAVCDIWSYSQRYAQGYLRKYGQDPVVYEDYRELLAKEKDLAAAIVATPDWVHALHANACLEAGLHVYCEKEMSNSLEKARTMVETARRTGQLLQIGHQRRSNPRYLHAINRLIRDRKILGRVNLAYAQWNRSRADMLGWPKTYPISLAKLQEYGYANMTEFRNWRWFKKYGGGPIVDLGSHQIDLFPWVFGSNPVSVTASGGVDYYPGREWYDNVMALFEFATPEGTARAMYQVQTTTKFGGFYEVFMGDDGAIQISEVADRGNWALREAHAPEWESLIREGLLLSEAPPIQKLDTKDIFVDVRVTAEAGRWPLPIELAKPAHQPHLENFFEAVRKRSPLSCPAELAYESAAAVLKVNEAVRTKSPVRFRPSDFKA